MSSLPLNSDSGNENRNTNQSGSVPTYRLDWFDPRTGIAQVQSPRSIAPYWVNAYTGVCSCPGFRRWSHCHHLTPGSVVWDMIFTAAGESGHAFGGQSVPCYDDFMDDLTLTDSEREADHRQEWDAGWPLVDRMAFQVLWGPAGRVVAG